MNSEHKVLIQEMEEHRKHLLHTADALVRKARMSFPVKTRNKMVRSMDLIRIRPVGLLAMAFAVGITVGFIRRKFRLLG